MESTTEIIQESAEASMNEVEANVSGLVQYLQDHIPDMVSFGIRLPHDRQLVYPSFLVGVPLTS